jgi:glycerophosphoryl diester phosphodiesterase
MGDGWPAGRPLVLAHRGWRGHRETTIDAVQAALAAGADAVEVDVRCTADGRPVLVFSFDRDVIDEVHRRAPAIDTGLVLGRRRAYRLPFPHERVGRLRPWLASPSPDALVLPRRFLALGLAGAVRALDRALVIWTVNRDSRPPSNDGPPARVGRDHRPPHGGPPGPQPCPPARDRSPTPGESRTRRTVRGNQDTP